MKIKEGYILREVAGSNIVVPIGNAQVSFNGIMTLNDVGTFIWKLLENGSDNEQILNAILEEYDVEKEIAERDLKIYIEKLRSKDLIED
jgi:hypothetical protein